jgi:hypothetical protein
MSDSKEAQMIGLLINRWPIGTRLKVEHDGFSGTVQGYYVTREGKPGLALQLDNAKVVHVYGEKWFEE